MAPGCRIPLGLVVLLGFVALAPACSPKGVDPTSAGQLLDAEKLTQAQKAKTELARQARDAMFAALLGELTTALEKGGPSSAISICRDRAPQIARETSEKMRLKIGRTSFRLRNPGNSPPAWAEALVEKRAQGPAYAALRGGAVGALLPIVTGAPCLTCHGEKDSLKADVRDAIAKHYPQDQATGFRAGDLRGWFWIEVP